MGVSAEAFFTSKPPALRFGWLFSNDWGRKMKFTTALKSLIGAAALTALASIASAATTFAEFDLAGEIEYTDNVLLFGFIPTGVAGGSGSGSLDADLYGRTDIVRPYTLEYSLSATWNANTGATAGSFGVGTFSIDNVIASLPTIPSTSGGVLPIPGGLLTYSGLTVTQSSIDGSYAFFFVGDALENTLVDFGFPAFPDQFSGAYNANFKLTSTVSTVPLPAAAPLLLVGIGGLVAFRRKRRKAA